jgi:predicted DNA-binding protein (MmcQ/YjbR family)
VPGVVSPAVIGRMSRAAGRYDQPVTKDELLAHCLSKPGAWQDEPWEGDTVVKVGPKIFAFLGSGDGGAIPDDEVVDAVDESYRMIVAKLAKRDRPA